MSYLSGKALQEELDRPDLGQEYLIEELIQKETSTMLVALPEVGKSVISMNLMASAACENRNKTFGLLRSKKCNCAYLQFEGNRDEQLGRLRAIREVFPFDYNSISWHEPMIIAEKSETWKDLEHELDERVPLDLIFIDPLYRVSLNGLKSESGAIPTIKWMDSLKKRYRASLWANHHSTKEQYDKEGGKIEKEDPYYGSIWLKAYFDNTYLAKRISKNEVSISCRKSRSSDIIRFMALDFDLSSWTLKANLEKTSIPASIRVKDILFKMKVGESIKTGPLSTKVEMSRRHLLRLRSYGDFNEAVTFQGEEGMELTWIRK